jgi:hypothetical protein
MPVASAEIEPFSRRERARKICIVIEFFHQGAFAGNLSILFFISLAGCWSCVSFWAAERIRPRIRRRMG